MTTNFDKIRQEMIAAGISPEKIAIYLESLDTVVELPVEKTAAVRPTKASVAMVVMSDGTIGRPDDGDPVEHWTR